MIRIANADPATRKFLDDISDLTYHASELGGRRAKDELTSIADHLNARRVDQLSQVDPATVSLTDEQWRQLTRKVKVLSGFGADTW